MELTKAVDQACPLVLATISRCPGDTLEIFLFVFLVGWFWLVGWFGFGWFLLFGFFVFRCLWFF